MWSGFIPSPKQRAPDSPGPGEYSRWLVSVERNGHTSVISPHVPLLQVQSAPSRPSTHPPSIICSNGFAPGLRLPSSSGSQRAPHPPSPWGCGRPRPAPSPWTYLDPAPTTSPQTAAVAGMPVALRHPPTRCGLALPGWARRVPGPMCRGRGRTSGRAPSEQRAARLSRWRQGRGKRVGVGMRRGC